MFDDRVANLVLKPQIITDEGTNPPGHNYFLTYDMNAFAQVDPSELSPSRETCSVVPATAGRAKTTRRATSVKRIAMPRTTASFDEVRNRVY